jgi:carboxypeptidase family protein
MPTRRQTVLCIAALTLGAGLLCAQTTVTSTILGTVSDPQGAAIPNAQVVLSNTATGRHWKTNTGADGHYVFPDLNAGTYRVGAQSSGFATTQSEPVTIGAAGTTQRIDISLPIAGSQQSRGAGHRA